MLRKSRIRTAAILLLSVAAAIAASARSGFRLVVGRQPNGCYIVATGQKVLAGTIAFAGRPIDIAAHPRGTWCAVVNQRAVLLVTHSGIVAGSKCVLAGRPSFHGCAWSPSGAQLFVSLSRGPIQVFRLDPAGRLLADGLILLQAAGDYLNPGPGGMSFTHDGSRLYVACANRGTVAEVDVASRHVLRNLRVQNIPFDVRLSDDQRTLVVSNWGGREPAAREDRADSGGVDVEVDRRGVPATGSVSLVDRATGRRRDVPVGLHPCGLAIAGKYAYAANAGSDTVSEIDLTRGTATRTLPVRWGAGRPFGSMPNALAVSGGKLYACLGGDNAVAEIDLASGSPVGLRPAGFFPVAVQIDRDHQTAYVLNTKGNGSVLRTARRRPGNVHDIQGTVSVLDLTSDLREQTRVALRLEASRMGWPTMWRRRGRCALPWQAVYGGAIRHVLYVIKENRTYDQVLGDIPQGNGDPHLCLFGDQVTPNQHALSREFGLFDNAYVCGTNSAEGHQWATEGLANDYIERFYADYSRGYPFDGGDAMAYASSGFIWDAAVAKGLKVRVYGEFCSERLADLSPQPTCWMDAWRDRASGGNRIHVHARTTVAGLRKLIHPNVVCWPLMMSDQWRADKFIEEYQRLSREDRVPNLMVLSLPSDHTEGLNPQYPTPRAMVADNDLALGRVVDAISHSPQWKDTCIFVMEDDAQAGLDHVDGHRTVCQVVSPWVRRGVVDSSLYTQASILRSIELMLGLRPMNRFDAAAAPFRACFSDTPDVRPYTAVQNRVPLDELNASIHRLHGRRCAWARRSTKLDWSELDSADSETLDRILWYDARGDAPYPIAE